MQYLQNDYFNKKNILIIQNYMNHRDLFFCMSDPQNAFFVNLTCRLKSFSIPITGFQCLKIK